MICITHQPQTACCGNSHLQVTKASTNGTTKAQLLYLTDDERVNEVARMLGGLNITDTTLQHAREMLNTSSIKI